MSLYFNLGAFHIAPLHSGQSKEEELRAAEDDSFSLPIHTVARTQSMSELLRLSEAGSVSLAGLEAMFILLLTKFSLGQPHTRSKTFSCITVCSCEVDRNVQMNNL